MKLVPDEAETLAGECLEMDGREFRPPAGTATSQRLGRQKQRNAARAYDRDLRHRLKLAERDAS